MQIGPLSGRLKVPTRIVPSPSNSPDFDPFPPGVVGAGVDMSPGKECRLPFCLVLLLPSRGHDGVLGVDAGAGSLSPTVIGVGVAAAEPGVLGVSPPAPPVLCRLCFLRLLLPKLNASVLHFISVSPSCSSNRELQLQEQTGQICDVVSGAQCPRRKPLLSLFPPSPFRLNLFLLDSILAVLLRCRFLTNFPIRNARGVLLLLLRSVAQSPWFCKAWLRCATTTER